MANLPRGFTIDITGKIFGRLTVTGYHGSRGAPHHAALWDCVCECGSSCIALGASLKSGAKSSCGCLLRESRARNADRARLGITIVKGPDHPRWNPDKSKHKRKHARSTKESAIWKSAVLDRDGYICVCCGSRENLEAHHLNSFRNFPELRTDVKNGVTLCRLHHRQFHRLYGIKRCTSEDFKEFLSSEFNL